VLGKMPTVYQSDVLDDAYSDDATSSEREHEEEEDDNEDKEKEGEETKESQDSDVTEDTAFEADDDKGWQHQLQLGPRTRRKPPVNYNAEKIIPAETPARVCRDLLWHCKSLS
jgi:hypothetical protein